ncbi:MAG: thioredoxin family protein [Nitrospirae bacterium]|nr:thioredoxin family protein [Nitrospirota bacterium]
MGMISEKDGQAIRDHFNGNLSAPVKIEYFTRPDSRIFVPGREECATCKETGELLGEVAALSDQLTLDVHDITRDAARADELGVKRVPAFVLSGAAKGRVRYFGIPSGYEFSALIEDLVDVSKGEADLSQKTLDALGTLDKDLHIQVFATPT